MTDEGRIVYISGPVVVADELSDTRLYDVVHVGELGLIGEVIRLAGDRVTIQVYEDTSGVRLGEPVTTTGAPLTVDLGPGLLGQVYDGLQRPLKILAENGGDFIGRGTSVSALSEVCRWKFNPCVKVGDEIVSGTVLGIVPESNTLTHRIMSPVMLSGTIEHIEAGEFTVNEIIATVRTGADVRHITLKNRWSVRQARPFHRKLTQKQPIITGTRVIDTFFPIAKGGAAIIPGGFGTGKTVVQHTLARWSDVDVVVYIGCGERGNEMTEVLNDFPNLQDPRTGEPLMQRTILIANTSDMPVAAREASIYTGMSIAEYYRDMGYDVLLLADSTSRWGEALREISGRLEEMPGEEGFPAYLGSRLAEYYERAGQVISEDQERTGSVTIVGAVSPPGGDFSEPITQGSMRVVGTFWALDYELSRRRHFPAISWTQSYSHYNIEIQLGTDWDTLVREAMALLQKEIELQEIVQLVGLDALTHEDQLVLYVSRILREDFLQQSALDEIDQYCPIIRTHLMLSIIMTFYNIAQKSDLRVSKIQNIPIVEEIARMRYVPHSETQPRLGALLSRLTSAFEEVKE